MNYSELTNEQARQSVDCEQAFAVWRDADRELRERFAGSMFWRAAHNGDGEYLYREVKGAQRSLGPRSPETEASFRAFTEGRNAVKETLRGTSQRLDAMAPVNKALRLNRVPLIAARILRRLDEVGLLGKPMRVAGTHVLYTMESACGVQVGSDLLATADVDLLWDSRAGLKLAVGSEVRTSGLLGVLQKLDRSFRSTGRNSFRAVNRDGYMVDLIAPPVSKKVMVSKPQRLGTDDDELTAVEIGGLAWLVNSPSFEQVVIGEDGYPLRMVTPDLRAWTVHKLWLSEQPDRVPAKRNRDRAQGLLAADLLRARRPDLRFDDDILQALPRVVRALIDCAARRLPADEQSDDGLRPNW